MSHGTDPILSVRDLRVSIGSKEIVRGISFDVASGETVGIVGESGSGKSLSVLSATRLLHMPHMTISGQSLLNGQDLISARRSALRRQRSWIRLPRSDDVPQPAADDRTATHRGAERSSGDDPQSSAPQGS